MENIDKLHIMSKILIVEETINRDLIERIFKGEKPEMILGAEHPALSINIEEQIAGFLTV